jgi:hypothetical protein
MRVMLLMSSRQQQLSPMPRWLSCEPLACFGARELRVKKIDFTCILELCLRARVEACTRGCCRCAQHKAARRRMNIARACVGRMCGAAARAPSRWASRRRAAALASRSRKLLYFSISRVDVVHHVCASARADSRRRRLSLMSCSPRGADARRQMSAPC